MLNDLSSLLRRFVILPPHAAETLALWVLHTYAFKLRDISTYIGIESPYKGCGKTTLLRVLGILVRKPVSTANVSPSALFRVIEELQPTLLIDEGDTFLRNNDELRGILNAGYTPDTAFVLRASNESTSSPSDTLSWTPKHRGGPDSLSGLSPVISSQPEGSPNTPPLQRSITPLPASSSSPLLTYQRINLSTPKTGFRQFSTWCPKAIAMIGRLPETLGDRCIIIRMQKKSTDQKCERLRDLDVGDLPARCETFVKEHADAIAKARPTIPTQLGDRAADIWEPLLVLADLASVVENSSEPLSTLHYPLSAWSSISRSGALSLSAKPAQEQNPIASLLSDIRNIFTTENTNRLWTRTIVKALNQMPDRPWRELLRNPLLTETWLAQTLSPHGLRTRNIRVGQTQAKGYYLQDIEEVFSS